ncbi:MAG: hypothetical protein JKX85_02900 [Phycisphaeraceae bacterium]|nr:hypothetical protein [Phycisphaeraceae bacterium]
MTQQTHGHRTWFFPDGDLPAAGDVDPKGHESLVILNPGNTDANLTFTIYFENQEPKIIDAGVVGAQRVRCYRMNEPFGDYQIPLGQYALKVQASEPVIGQIGRMDVQQPNLAYYTVMGMGF